MILKFFRIFLQYSNGKIINIYYSNNEILYIYSEFNSLKSPLGGLLYLVI